MDGGSKSRRRFTAVNDNVSYTLIIPSAGLQVLLDFMLITLRETGQFSWVDFRDPARGPANYRFRSRPSYRPETRWLWRVSIQLEITTPMGGTFPLDVHDITTWPTT
ncbi:hypothetical protein Xmar_07715 [Xanthomonas axonopodis pv. martyniicola]|nr:hypothetical protein Xmar_07715 [Xanthomonas axonopodis pv. martyniicola]OOW90157.1 hypothetical protein Xvtr_19120 [Xanthomonas campestris pv. vitiscarnosae]